MIAGHADAQRDRDHCLAQQKTLHAPPVKRLARQQWTGAVLEHGVRVRFRREFSSYQTAFRRFVHARKEKAAEGAVALRRSLTKAEVQDAKRFPAACECAKANRACGFIPTQSSPAA